MPAPMHLLLLARPEIKKGDNLMKTATIVPLQYGLEIQLSGQKPTYYYPSDKTKSLKMFAEHIAELQKEGFQLDFSSLCK